MDASENQIIRNVTTLPIDNTTRILKFLVQFLSDHKDIMRPEPLQIGQDISRQAAQLMQLDADDDEDKISDLAIVLGKLVGRWRTHARVSHLTKTRWKRGQFWYLSESFGKF